MLEFFYIQLCNLVNELNFLLKLLNILDVYKNISYILFKFVFNLYLHFIILRILNLYYLILFINF